MVVDWLQTSPGGTGVFRCFMAEAISRSCTGLIPGCPSESGWAKGDMGTGPQARCPGALSQPCSPPDSPLATLSLKWHARLSLLGSFDPLLEPQPVPLPPLSMAVCVVL